MASNKKIIVIDNYNYLEDLLKYTKYNFFFHKIEDKNFDEAMPTLERVLLTDEFRNQSLQFIINVHVQFVHGYYVEQTGVDIYRYLLYIYRNKIDLVSFIFYSPLLAEELVKLKPSNAVLNHLPLLELPCSDLYQLNVIISQHCNLFNNSSENLLAGYHLCGDRSIGKKQTILVLDDQYNEWEYTLKLIFKESTVFSLSHGDTENYKSFYTLILNDKTEDSDRILSKALEMCDMVITDLYLTENHEPGLWKSLDEARNISGYQLIRKLRKINEFVPVVLFSTSNRARNYFLMNTQNLNGWCIKDNRPILTDETRKEYFNEYSMMCENTITNFDIQLRKLWEKLNNIYVNYENLWWYCLLSENRNKDKIKNVVLRNIEQSLSSFRRYINQQRDISKANDTKFYVDQLDDFTINSIIVQLAKSVELIYLNTSYSKDRRKKNALTKTREEYEAQIEDFQDDISRYLYIIRCNAAHGAIYHNIYPIDVLCSFIYLIDLLSLNNVQIKNYIKPDKLKKICRSHETYYHLLNSINFFNHPSSCISKTARNLLSESIQNYIYRLGKNKTNFALAIIANGIPFTYNPHIADYEGLKFKIDTYGQIQFFINKNITLPISNPPALSTSINSLKDQIGKIDIDCEIKKPISNELTFIYEVDEVMKETYSSNN